MLVIREVCDYPNELLEQRRLVGCLRHTDTLEQAPYRGEDSAVVLDQNFQLATVVQSAGAHALVQPAGKLLVGEVGYEHGVQLLEQRNETDECAMALNPLDQRHQLAMLVRELAENLR